MQSDQPGFLVPERIKTTIVHVSSHRLTWALHNNFLGCRTLKYMLCKALVVLKEVIVRQRCKKSRPYSRGCLCSGCHAFHVCAYMKHAVTWRRGFQLHGGHCPEQGSREEERPQQGSQAEEARWRCSPYSTGAYFEISYHQDAYAARIEESVHCTTAYVYICQALCLALSLIKPCSEPHLLSLRLADRTTWLRI